MWMVTVVFFIDAGDLWGFGGGGASTPVNYIRRGYCQGFHFQKQ